ncbi:hypothetical protein SLS62_001840 [Diatrype stigma]|uniref:Uncharacterized protein n=1 Tax=Diatrype stigma TaxID=117547 RepID=A0AAN9YT51_9PEZI
MSRRRRARPTLNMRVGTGILVFFLLYTLVGLFAIFFAKSHVWLDLVHHEICEHFKDRDAEDQAMRVISFTRLYTFSVEAVMVAMALVCYGMLYARQERYGLRPLISTLCYCAAIACFFISTAASSKATAWVEDPECALRIRRLYKKLALEYVDSWNK